MATSASDHILGLLLLTEDGFCAAQLDWDCLLISEQLWGELIDLLPATDDDDEDIASGLNEDEWLKFSWLLESAAALAALATAALNIIIDIILASNWLC